jgi:hypothetical protein
MRNLTIALSAIAVASMSLIGAADAAYVSKCKKPEKWNAVEAKCEKPVKKPVAMKKKA